MKSGTHVLLEYVKKYFDVDICNKMTKKDTGTVTVSGNNHWKHFIPTSSLIFAEEQSETPLVILLTIRDLCSWILALARGSYEIHPHPKAKRRKFDYRWLLNKICVNPNSKNPEYFDNATQLWCTYAFGYATCAICSNSKRLRVIVVRTEDLVKQPDAVLEDLTRAGLPRNRVPFAAIDEHHGGHLQSGDTRQKLLEDINNSLYKFDKHAIEKIGEAVKDFPGLFLHFGYKVSSSDVARQHIRQHMQNTSSASH
jgi:hypothetical protein